MVTGHVLALAAVEGIAYQDAPASWPETDDRHGEGTELGYHGMVLTHLREFKRAIPFLQDAVAIFRETGDRDREGQALRTLGVALQGAGPSEVAITASQCPPTPHRRGWEIALAIFYAVLALGIAAGALSNLSGGRYANSIYLGLVAVVAGRLAAQRWKR